jgi:hypothetical protein
MNVQEEHVQVSNARVVIVVFAIYTVAGNSVLRIFVRTADEQLGNSSRVIVRRCIEDARVRRERRCRGRKRTNARASSTCPRIARNRCNDGGVSLAHPTIAASAKEAIAELCG